MTPPSVAPDPGNAVQPSVPTGGFVASDPVTGPGPEPMPNPMPDPAPGPLPDPTPPENSSRARTAAA